MRRLKKLAELQVGKCLGGSIAYVMAVSIWPRSDWSLASRHHSLVNETNKPVSPTIKTSIPKFKMAKKQKLFPPEHPHLLRCAGGK